MEITFEMLVLGVLLNEHGAEALEFPEGPAWMLARLSETQDLIPLAEKPIKVMRGLLKGLAEGEAEEDDRPDDLLDDLQYSPAAELVHCLVTWLRAQGQSAQADRMSDWQDYLAQLSEKKARAILAACRAAGLAFAVESDAELGEYTQAVEGFVDRAQVKARWRYDSALVTRERVEYHLAMLGTEILSRAYREKFMATKRRIVIMPDCLRSNDGDQCQAERTSLGGKCQGCTPGCKVMAITRLGEKHGFEAYILPDDLRGIGLGSCSKLANTGVIGISCVLTNWDGGWQVNAAGVPAQGVLLDHPGCKSHWSQDGIPTDVNLDKVVETATQ
jgi:hypothetical protein